jgi:hypothetical protein
MASTTTYGPAYSQIELPTDSVNIIDELNRINTLLANGLDFTYCDHLSKKDLNRMLQMAREGIADQHPDLEKFLNTSLLVRARIIET